MKNNNNKPNQSKINQVSMLTNKILYGVSAFEKNQHLHNISDSLVNSNDNVLIAVEREIFDTFDIFIINKNGKHLILSDEPLSELQLVGRFNYIILHSYSPDYFETFKQQIG